MKRAGLLSYPEKFILKFLLFISGISLVFLNACGGNQMVLDPSFFKTTRQAVNDSPTFLRDIKPLVQQKCAGCHGPGKMNPKDWTDYATASANKSLIDRRVWEIRDMPMGGSLEEAQRAMIHAWVSTGAPQGSADGAPAPTPTATSTSAPEPTPTTTPTTTPNPGTTPTYLGRIQGIFQARCTMCHGAGKMHPKDWSDYATAFSNRALIDRRVWEVRDMPMGGNITDEERAEIHAWVAGGAPESGGAQPTPTATPTTTPSPTPTPTSTATSTPVPSSPVYVGDVQAIFQNRCTMCHGPGKMHPKDWSDYATAFSNRALIDRRVWEVRDMPMGGNITEAERARIHQWIADGAPETGTVTPSPSPTPVPTPSPTGGTPRYSDAKKIFEARCKSCHDHGVNSPDLFDYEEARLFRWQIRAVVLPGVAHPAASPNSITDAERSFIRYWADSGAPN